MIVGLKIFFFLFNQQFNCINTHACKFFNQYSKILNDVEGTRQINSVT